MMTCPAIKAIEVPIAHPMPPYIRANGIDMPKLANAMMT